jgi:hypothetical protein
MIDVGDAYKQSERSMMRRELRCEWKVEGARDEPEKWKSKWAEGTMRERDEKG